MRYENKNKNRRDVACRVSTIGVFIILSIFSAKAQNHWTPNINAFDNYMTITGFIMQNGQELQSDKYEVGCFVDNECRGVYRLQPISYKEHPYTCFLAVWGSAEDNGKEITILVYDRETENVYGAIQKPIYQYNGDLGTEIPYELTLLWDDGVGFAKVITKEKPINAWVQDGMLHISGLEPGKQWSVYNISGTLIYQNIATDTVETWHAASLPNRVYIVKSGNATLKIIY